MTSVAQESRLASADSLLQAQRERLEPKLAQSDTWDDLLRYVALATERREYRLLSTSEHAIIWGETDGIAGMERVIQLRELFPGSLLIVTGGVYGRQETIGDYPAFTMFEALRTAQLVRGASEEAIGKRVIVDSVSQHTGHQRLIIPANLKALGIECVSVVIPLYHMPRFLASVGKGFMDAGMKPTIFPQPFGSLETHHMLKGLTSSDGTFSYEELLCLPPTPSHGVDTVKSDDCGELDKLIGYQQPDNLQALTFRQGLELLSFS